MPTHIGIGFSNEIDTEVAASEAAIQSKTALNADTADLALIFSTIHYDPKLILSSTQNILNTPKIIGSSTAGIILSQTIETRGIAVLTINSDEIKFGTSLIDSLNEHSPRRAGANLARDTLSDFGRHGRHAFIFFVDGQFKDTATLLVGIQEILGNVFPILGAGSSDDFHFEKTFQLYNDSVMHNAASGLILGGHMNIGVGSQHGWRPLGKPRVIDKAENNIIHSISGQNAFSFYREYFGAETDSLRSNQFGQMSILYPLGIFIEGSDEYLLRNVAEILPDGSIVCQGDVPEGAEVHIMLGNKDSCKQAAIHAAEDAQKNLLGKPPKLVIIFESMARLKLLGRSAFEEIENIKYIFGANTPIIGMYTNGEISPFQTVEKFKKPYLLNESITVIAIG